MKTIDFGKTAKDYGQHRQGFPTAFFSRLKAFGIGSPGQYILDLGTGTGTIARGLALAGADVTALDPSTELIAQAEALDIFLSKRGQSLSAVLSLEVKEDELRQRLAERAKSSGRPDDANPEVIQKRIDVYKNETLPLKDHFTSQGKYKGINGIGEINEIFNSLCAKIDELK